MQDYSIAQLSFLIQEGQANTPEVREALVRQFSPLLYTFAYALLEDEVNRPGASLALTTSTYRAALKSQSRLQVFDTPKTWLLSEMLGQIRRRKSRREILSKLIKFDIWTILFLRYHFSLTIPHIAEITNTNDETIITSLRRHRNRLNALDVVRGKGHIINEVNQALDGLITWQEADQTQHMTTCAACRQELGALQKVEEQLKTAFSSTQPEPLSELGVNQILEELENPQDNKVRHQFKPMNKEAWWIAGAIAAFLYISIALNSFWTPTIPLSTSTPDLPEAEEVEILLRELGYEDLERALLFSSPPYWEPGEIFDGDWTPTTDLAFSSDGKFAGFGDQETVILWDLNEKTQTPLGKQNSGIKSVSFLESEFIAASDMEGTLHVWDIAEKVKRYILQEETPIQHFSFSEKNKILITATETTISVWEISDAQLVRVRQFNFHGVTNLTASQDGGLFAVTDKESAISIWRLDDFSFQLRFSSNLIIVTKLLFSPNGNRLAVLGAGGHIHIFGFSQTAEDSLIGTMLFQLNHPWPVKDFSWLDEGRYLAALSEYSIDLIPPYLMTWEMTTGLPASFPVQISNMADINQISGLQNGQFVVTGNDGSLTFPVYSEVASGPTPTEFNQSKTDIFPSDVFYQTTQNPFTQTYSSSLETVSALIALDLPLNVLIPDQYNFIGAAYDPANEIASYKFTRSMAPNHDEVIVLRIRPLAPGERLTMLDDWISARADFRHKQIGRYLGELVTGEWIASQIPQDVPGILRWTQTNTTKFRWRMGRYLYELISESDIATEERRWNRFFEPLAVAIIGGDQQIPIFEYAVVEGDTCLGISARFGTTVGRLTSLNNLDNDCTIIAGALLKIPVPPPLGIYIGSDLNCDGSIEQIRLIPAPSQPNTGVYFGMVIDALPAIGDEPEANYATYDSFTIADVDVAFFSPPSLVNIEGACGQLIAITGYGGSGEESGLRFFLWTGETLRLALHTNGFLDKDLFSSISEDFTFTTQRLEYDRTQAACTLYRTTFAWNNNAFSIIGEETKPGVDCFEELLP